MRYATTLPKPDGTCQVCGGPLADDPEIAKARHELGRATCMDSYCQSFARPKVAVVGAHKQGPQVVSHGEALGHNYDTKGRV